MTINHTNAMQELADQFQPVLDNSPDGVYIWLDEGHKVCNEHLAKLFGCSVQEWCEQEPFLETFVAPEDREMFSMNYHASIARLAYPVTFRFQALRMDGTTFAAETDMIPISWRGHAVAYHFVRALA